MNDQANGIKTYSIYGLYDQFQSDAFNQYLLDSVDILSYWNHLPLLYFVKTRLAVGVVSSKIKPFFGGSWYIVIEVNPVGADGWLPQPAWDWFTTPAPTFKVPSPPPPPRITIADLMFPKK
ncbi:hypothetical protein [Mesorhizobium sp. IMUNJ 23232]|uniref:hypothetical protein n=1 Tax=Mesorhizobium sp. IMUNJ 23232 TaxID=3376064 RepID=UPI0037A6B20F